MMKKLILLAAFCLVASPLMAQGPTALQPWSSIANDTAVSVNAASAADQFTQSIAEPGTGNLNYGTRFILFHAAGKVVNVTSGAGTWTIKIQLCTDSGHGTCVAAVTFPATASQGNATTQFYDFVGRCAVTTTGSSGVVTCDGFGVQNANATSTIMQDGYTASSAIDLTKQGVWYVTVADSGASANNTITNALFTRTFLSY